MDSISEEGIIVAVRIRPLSKKELASGIVSCCQTLGESNIAIRKNGDANNFLKSQMAMLNEYAFDAVFDEDSTQEEVYESTAKKFIPNVINGKNVTVFAYGATGAGKTHTMLGNSRADSSAAGSGLGIIPSAVKDMFSQISRKYANADEHSNIQDKWTVTLSYIEVYNEQVYDLLGSTAGKVLPVREDQTRDIVVVAGMTEQVVASYDEVMIFMAQGNRNRKTEATMANAVSSRSHAVLQLVVRHSMLRLDTNKETEVVKESTWVERELRLRQENAALRARVCELTKLWTEAQSFRDNVLHKCANEASLEDIKRLVEEHDESLEIIRSSGSESDNSFSSDSVATSTEGSSPASSALSLTPEAKESVPTEMFGRGKRRASMSAVPAPKAVAASAVAAKVTKTVPSAIVPIVAAPTAVLPATAPVAVSALHEVPSEFDEMEVTSMSCVSATATRRRQSSVPAPVARSTTRRASLAPKLSATAAALKAVAEIASAPVQPVTLAPSMKNTSKAADTTSRITRRKSLLSSSAPVALSAIAEVPDVVTETMVIDNAPDTFSADVESDKEVTETVVITAELELPTIEETVMPTVDPSFDDSVPQRRALQRRTSVGGSSIPQLGEARSSRRKSIAQVTAMLASIDSISNLLRPSSSVSVGESQENNTALKKRGAEMVAADAEDVCDENAKRRKASRMSLGTVAEVVEAPEHVWIDI
eukprot:gene8900-10518_t